MIALIAGAVAGMTLHEWAHARAALMAGDPTPAVFGRVTLNPLRHADPIGSFLAPLLSWWLTGYPIGWGRTVPIDARWCRGFKPLEAVIYLAGPLANVVMATLFGALALVAPELEAAARVNAVLAVFNLLPLPGLDGWRLLKLWTRP